jgi:imidazolonepropionase-like amidohydrolase
MTGGFVPGRYSSSVFIETVEQAREKADRILNEGADQLKIMLESIRGNEVMSESAAKAITEVAHQRGKKVSAHISLSRDIETALNVEVDDLAHMAIDKLSDDLIKKVVKGGIYWTPTIEAWKEWEMDDNVLDNLGRFAKAGGKVALGTDFVTKTNFTAETSFELGMPLKEILWMQEAGMSPSQIIVAATKNAAVVCDMGFELGTLEPGKIADILVVDGNPLQDLASLKKALLVIKGGKIIRQ